MLSPDEALRQLLIGAAGNSDATKAALSGLVGSRAYAIEAPQGAPDPRIEFHLVSGPSEYTHDGEAGLTHPRFQVECYGKTAAAALAVRKAAKANLSGFKGTVNSADGTDSVDVGAIFIENLASFTYSSPGADQNIERGYRMDVILWCAE